MFKFYLSEIDDYAIDGGPGEVWLLCRFYHGPLRTWIEANVNKFAISNHATLKLNVEALRSYSSLICEYELYILPDKKVSTAKNHGETYLKDRPHLVCHLLRNCLLISLKTVVHVLFAVKRVFPRDLEPMLFSGSPKRFGIELYLPCLMLVLPWSVEGLELRGWVNGHTWYHSRIVLTHTSTLILLKRINWDLSKVEVCLNNLTMIPI